MKLISFSQQGPRAVCILSANGVISNVTLHQQDSSGGTLTYEVCTFVLSWNTINIDLCLFCFSWILSHWRQFNIESCWS